MGLIEKLDGINKRVEALETSNIEGFDEVIARVEKLYGRITIRAILKTYSYTPFFLPANTGGAMDTWSEANVNWGDADFAWNGFLYPADDLYSDFVF